MNPKNFDHSKSNATPLLQQFCATTGDRDQKPEELKCQHQTLP